MAHKTEFQKEKPNGETLPERCCGRCAHGVPIADTVGLKTMIECHCMPPSAQLVSVQTPQGIGTQLRALRPVMAQISACGQFQAQPPKTSA